MNSALRSRTWASMVLGWFMLGLGMATAAPLLQAVPMQIVCSADGQLRLLVADGDAWDEPAQAHALHCPLCLLGAGAAPVRASAGTGLVMAAVATVPHHHKTTLVPGHRSGAPLPARGPPAHS
ncbi:MAG: hypothetical protein M0Q87_13790 [Ottowia sp.]|nr:hypothetical protein [Ottowia sp.]